MKKKSKKIVFPFFLLWNLCSYAQIGVGTEVPTQEFEIKGTVRFKELDQNLQLTRQLLSDDEGNLTAAESVKDRLYYDNLQKELMPYPVLVGPNETKDLGVELVMEIKPLSETVVILTYNIPIYSRDNTILNLPEYGGVKLASSRDGNLPLGARKFTFPLSYGINNTTSRGAFFIEGKYVDVISNTTNQVETVKYTLQGFIENGNAASFYFSDGVGNGSFGVGIFSGMVFYKGL